MAHYPRMAQIAHIMGPVTIEFTLDASNAVAIRKSTGHPLLVPAAEETIRGSKLHCANCNESATAFTVVFDSLLPITIAAKLEKILLPPSSWITQRTFRLLQSLSAHTIQQ